MNDELVLVGRISQAHGLKGEVKIASFTAVPTNIGSYGSLTTVDKTLRFELSAVRDFKDGLVIAKIRGVNDRTAAEKLRGIELYIHRSALPETEEEEYYHSDLIGLTAVDTSGNPIGEVSGVYNFGAGDLLEIRLAMTNRTELVPFDAANVPEVDISARRVTIAAEFGAEDEAEAPS